MTEIREGESYIARHIKKGNSERGPYEIVIIQGKGKGQPAIALSVLNIPSGMGVNNAFTIVKIYSVAVRNYQDKKGVWHKGGSITVRAVINPIYDMREINRISNGQEMLEPEDVPAPSIEDWFS